MDYQRKLGETKNMAPRASTVKSLPVNEKVPDTSYTEKVESKEGTKLSDNFQTVTLEKTVTLEVKPRVVYGVALALLILSFWHPYWALFAAVGLAVRKYSEDWDTETEDFFNVDIGSLLKSRQASEINHPDTDLDYMKGVYIARRNKQKIAKAITDGDNYCLVYVGWQDYPRDVKNGLAKELGLKPEHVRYSNYPLFMEVWF